MEMDKRKLPDMSHYPKCRRMMQWHKLNMIIRIISVVAIGFLNIFHVSFMKDMLLLWGTVLTYIIILVMAGLSIMNRPVLTYSVIILFALGILLKMVNPFLGVLPVFLYFWHTFEFKQAAWLREQVGYPHFNARLTEQEWRQRMESYEDSRPAYQYTEYDDTADDTPTKNAFVCRMKLAENEEMPSLEDIGMEEL